MHNTANCVHQGCVSWLTVPDTSCMLSGFYMPVPDCDIQSHIWFLMLQKNFGFPQDVLFTTHSMIFTLGACHNASMHCATGDRCIHQPAWLCRRWGLFLGGLQLCRDSDNAFPAQGYCCPVSAQRLRCAQGSADVEATSLREVDAGTLIQS